MSNAPPVRPSCRALKRRATTKRRERARLQPPRPIDTMSTIEEETIAKLQAILAELNAMTPLSPAGTPGRTPEEHEEWMRRHKAITDRMRQAELQALATLPAFVSAPLFAINQRALELFGAIPERTESEENPNA